MVISSSGYVTMSFGYWAGSDETIKQILKLLKMH